MLSDKTSDVITFSKLKLNPHVKANLIKAKMTKT